MRSQALAFLLAILIAWMGFAAQTEAASLTSESLAEHVLAAQAGTSLADAQARAGGSLDDHHLDDLPIQLLADLVGLLCQPGVSGPAGLAIRPDVPLAQAGPPPYLDGLRRPPIRRD